MGGFLAWFTVKEQLHPVIRKVLSLLSGIETIFVTFKGKSHSYVLSPLSGTETVEGVVFPFKYFQEKMENFLRC